MLEKIRQKWNQYNNYVERKDIEAIQRHPKSFKILIISYPLFFILISLFMIALKPSFFIVILFVIPFLYSVEKTMYNRYKKALNIQKNR